MIVLRKNTMKHAKRLINQCLTWYTHKTRRWCDGATTFHGGLGIGFRCSSNKSSLRPEPQLTPRHIRTAHIAHISIVLLIVYSMVESRISLVARQNEDSRRYVPKAKLGICTLWIPSNLLHLCSVFYFRSTASTLAHQFIICSLESKFTDRKSVV